MGRNDGARGGARCPVGSRFRGNDEERVGVLETGRVAPRLVGACAPDWIPAYAGMTAQRGRLHTVVYTERRSERPHHQHAKADRKEESRYDAP